MSASTPFCKSSALRILTMHIQIAMPLLLDEGVTCTEFHRLCQYYINTLVSDLEKLCSLMIIPTNQPSIQGKDILAIIQESTCERSFGLLPYSPIPAQPLPPVT